MHARPVLALFLSAPVLLLAQASGSLSGVVYDPLGNPAYALEVRVSGADGRDSKAMTSPGGQYSFADLASGGYRVAVFVHGSRMFDRDGVAIRAGEAAKLDIHIEDRGQLGAIGDNAFAAAIIASKRVPDGPTPRALDGHPDLSGVWAPFIELSATETELLPWAIEEMNLPNRMSPNAYCLPQGPKLAGPTPIKLIQAPKTVVALIEDVFVYRQIHTDGRARPQDADPTWMGYSIGHWEGDTLVVETANLNDKSWLPFNRPHKESLRVTERIRRPDEGHLDYEFIVDDPETFTKPWSVKYTTTLLVDDEIGEYVCAENEQDIGHYKPQ